MTHHQERVGGWTLIAARSSRLGAVSQNPETSAPVASLSGIGAASYIWAKQDDAMIYVCSLAALAGTVMSTGATHILTVMGKIDRVQRPVSVLEDNHMLIAMDDISEPVEGLVAPSSEHVERALAFVRRWDRQRPLVVHCYAGISRSTASAFAAACALNPHRDEAEIARSIRKASPSAFPNRLIVSLADRALGRGGRMLRALDAIGPGNMSTESQPFRVDLE